MAGSLLSEVVTELNRREDDSIGEIARSKLDRWLQSDEAEVLGAAYALLSEPNLYERVSPPLKLEELSAFLQTYFSRCLREDPKGEWVDSRYTAGWDIVRWFAAWWGDALVPRELLANWKRWLGDLYIASDAAIRECIETATLEHLFERAELREFFKDWDVHPVLGPAYRRSLVGPTGHLLEPD